ncbi:MAG: hypothetical protein EAZ95_05555 [Bacteroidetes bacterium]|nr:MAG: hypothetical protein EAZ95_05555 [Bacteroidota bacterium]
MFVRFYGACALAVALLTSCGGEKAENKTDKKEEPKTEATDKKPEPEQKPEAPVEKDLASQLIGEWVITKSFDPSGAEDGGKGSLTLTKTGFTRMEGERAIKGTWKLDSKLKNEESAVDCLVLNGEGEGETSWNVMSITDKELVLIFTTMPQKHIYKRK